MPTLLSLWRELVTVNAHKQIDSIYLSRPAWHKNLPVRLAHKWIITGAITPRGPQCRSVADRQYLVVQMPSATQTLKQMLKFYHEHTFNISETEIILIMPSFKLKSLKSVHCQLRDSVCPSVLRSLWFKEKDWSPWVLRVTFSLRFLVVSSKYRYSPAHWLLYTAHYAFVRY